jgi:putative endonuclease
MKGYMYILECSDGSYYTGSTNDLELRFQQHQNAEGANHTKKRLPVKLVYHEEYQRIDDAFYREKQVQGWSRKKKEALINGEPDKLPELSINHLSVPSESLGAIKNSPPVVEPVETTAKHMTPSASSGTEAQAPEFRHRKTLSSGD